MVNIYSKCSIAKCFWVLSGTFKRLTVRRLQTVTELQTLLEKNTNA